MSEPATRQDLVELETGLLAKLATKIELAEAVARLEGKMARLERQIGEATMHVANVVLEGVRAQIAALDDKYRDLPAGHATLRSELEAHVADTRIHVSTSPPPKRTRTR